MSGELTYADVVAGVSATIAAYGHAVDDGRTDDVVATYCPDGGCDIQALGAHQGHDALRAAYRSVHSLLMTAFEPDVEVLVVGAGITGIYQLYRAREAGFSACLLEAGDGVGGTWFWNRYPGARFDSESYTYGYLFSRELFEEWRWSEHFAGQPEIERYLNHVVDRFDLRRHIRLRARVDSASYDEATATWAVTTADGTRTTTRFLIAATGVLSVPFFPDVPGRDDFRGV